MCVKLFSQKGCKISSALLVDIDKNTIELFSSIIFFCFSRCNFRSCSSHPPSRFFEFSSLFCGMLLSKILLVPIGNTLFESGIGNVVESDVVGSDVKVGALDDVGSHDTVGAEVGVKVGDADGSDDTDGAEDGPIDADGVEDGPKDGDNDGSKDTDGAEDGRKDPDGSSDGLVDGFGDDVGNDDGSFECVRKHVGPATVDGQVSSSESFGMVLPQLPSMLYRFT